MASYDPPIENDPIFNSLFFQLPNNKPLTKADANSTYLERVDTAISIASSTSFASDISVGKSLLDYTAGTGLSIKGTSNGESIFMNVLNAGGVQKDKIELNPNHTHLYDQMRITDSSFTTEYTSIQQVLNDLTVSNIYFNSLTLIRGDPLSVASIGLSSSGVNINGNSGAIELNGLSVNNAIFGRNDIAANTFNGTLGYIRHPIGWTIAVTKSFTLLASGTDINIISVGTPTTAFTALSNGVWEIGCCCTNIISTGAITVFKMFYGAATNMTCINGTIGSVAADNISHQTNISNQIFSISYPPVLLRATGNGTTNINVSFNTTYTVAPIITFNIYATKVA